SLFNLKLKSVLISCISFFIPCISFLTPLISEFISNNKSNIFFSIFKSLLIELMYFYFTYSIINLFVSFIYYFYAFTDTLYFTFVSTTLTSLTNMQNLSTIFNFIKFNLHFPDSPLSFDLFLLHFLIYFFFLLSQLLNKHIFDLL